MCTATVYFLPTNIILYLIFRSSNTYCHYRHTFTKHVKNGGKRGTRGLTAMARSATVNVTLGNGKMTARLRNRGPYLTTHNNKWKKSRAALRGKKGTTQGHKGNIALDARLSNSQNATTENNVLTKGSLYLYQNFVTTNGGIRHETRQYKTPSEPSIRNGHVRIPVAKTRHTKAKKAL